MHVQLVICTSDFAFFSAAISCTLSLCSFGAERYMSNSSFISLWDSWAFLFHNHIITISFPNIIISTSPSLWTWELQIRKKQSSNRR